MVKPALFFKELLENRVKFWVFMFLLGGLAIAIPLLFEFTGNLLGKVELSSYVDPGEISFILSDYSNYAWSQWTAKNLTQIASLAAIVLGMGALAAESAYGTAPFLLSKPLTRRQVYTTKVAAGIFLLALVIFGSTLILILVSATKGYSLQGGALFVSTVVVFFGAAVVYLGTTVFSVLISDPVKAGVAAGLFWGLASLPGFFREAVHYSIFFQMKAPGYWLSGDYPWPTLLIFLGLAFLLYETGVYFWKKRDF